MLVDNAKIVNTINELDRLKVSFKTIGEELIENLGNALDSFEGETKDVLMTKIGQAKNFSSNTLAYFLVEQVPDLLEGLSELLEGNRKAIEDCDKNLAQAIK